MTKGLSTAAALTNFGTDKFVLATNLDLTRLFGAFGFAYTSVNNQLKALSITQPQASSFVSYLGNTYTESQVASLGMFNDLNNGKGYACIGWGVCTSNAFVNDYDLGSHSLFGSFLVRTAETDVPEPASLALLGLGVAGIAAARRRRQK